MHFRLERIASAALWLALFAMPGGAGAHDIDELVSTYHPEAAEPTEVGHQFWFVDKSFLDGRTLKLSVVAPGEATHAPHRHAEDEFFFVLEGRAEFLYEGESRIVEPYTSLYCPPNRLHGIRNAGDTELKYLVIKRYDPAPSAQAVRDTMARATTFMLDTVSHRDGFVWYYLPDFSRRWGELEATPTMVWVQPPGTATVGHVLLDAYHATGDALFLRGTKRVADALLAGQHPSGGWNYMFDLAGEAALRQWYETVGANAWRLEEFQHYLDNATFDDGGTYEATLLLLRLYQQGHAEARHERGLRRALDFVLDSQYPIGGWPQRYPTESNGPVPYASHLTFNDGVAANNIRLLLQAHRVLGEERLLRAARRGMDAFLSLQRKAPQPGWALQYTLDLQPAPARSYEAAGLSPAATAGNIRQLMLFYKITGDSAFLTPIPAALDWLDSLRLPPELVRDGRTHPRLVELGSNRPLFIHRTGSNAVNGRYYLDDDPNDTVVHYPSTGRIDVAELRERFSALGRQPQHPSTELPRYYITANTLGRIPGNQQRLRDEPVPPARAARIIDSLNEQDYWPTELNYTTHPYRGPGPAEPVPGDYRDTWVGDDSDTSPFYLPQPRPVIALDTYIANMARLVRYLREAGLAVEQGAE